MEFNTGSWFYSLETEAMKREDVERLLHCARTEGMGAGPNTLAEVCEWALDCVQVARDKALEEAARAVYDTSRISAVIIRTLKSKKETK